VSWRLRYFEFYEQIPKRARIAIQKRLGIRDGYMRSLAEFTNARCVVAFRQGRPIAWCALIPKRGGAPWMQVFVLRRWRRRGLGRRMVIRMCARAKLWGKPCRHSSYSKALNRFFDASGFHMEQK